MKAVTHVAGIVYSAHTTVQLDLVEGDKAYTQLENMARCCAPIFLVCKGAVFVMPWYEVKSEFARIANWYKLESPTVKKPYFRLKVLKSPIGNEEILTALYAGIEDLSRTESAKP